MENSQTQNSSSHEMFMKILQHPEILKEKLQTFIDEEKQMFGESLNEIADLSNYVVENWRAIVPPLVAFGLTVLLKQTEDMKAATPAKNDDTDETLLN